jgi:hypothetical protein
MKTIRLLLGLALIATAGNGFAAQPPPTKDTKASAAEKKKEEYKLPETGKNIERSNGGWINAEATGTRMTLKFFDKEFKPVPPDKEKGYVQFRYPTKNAVRATLYLEGQTLVTPATLRPPHNYLAIITLTATEDAEVGETYTFKYP